MTAVTNPALQAFVGQIGPEMVLTQVLILKRGAGFELRHLSDREVGAQLLRAVAIARLRELAQFNDAGVFRPLRSPHWHRGGI